jgi:hypothetical protein
MLLEIFQDDRKLATLEISSNGEVRFTAKPNKDFEEFILSRLRHGITQLRDVYNYDTSFSIIMEEPIKETNPSFPLAVRQFLERAGYKVIEKHPEAEKEIRDILADFPDDNPDRADILKRLPEMGYLEQTFLLGALKSK